MGRYTFGGGSSDWAGSPYKLGAVYLWQTREATVTFWDSQVGGLQHTDLIYDSSSVTQVPTTTAGFIPLFQGPDGVESLWADDSVSGRRVRLFSPQGIPGTPGPAYPSVWIVDDLVAEGIPASAIPNQHFLLDMATGDFYQIMEV